VIVENDANALAVLAIHQVHYAEPDLVVVAVFDEGVGGGLVMDGRLRRGGNGRAMEIGHLIVGYPPGQEEPHGSPPGPAGPGFSTPCTCGHFGHVDTLATPRRIRAMLGGARLDQLGSAGPGDPGFRQAREIFAYAGAALGRALAHVSNTVNPSKIIAYLPAPLAEPQPGTAAAAYLSAVSQEVTPAFAAGTQDDYLTVRPLPAEPEDAALLGARAAAVCVLESFIEHALRLDGCTTTLRRTSSTGEFKAFSPQKLITRHEPELLFDPRTYQGNGPLPLITRRLSCRDGTRRGPGSSALPLITHGAAVGGPGSSESRRLHS
jgi:predicted NBD/HSP70 family sugar kinase